MRQHFPMNLHGKQIGHVLGYIPGALYGQAVLQGMSRAYQGVLEEANRRIVGYDACVLGYDPTYSTFSSSSCGFAGGSSIERCAPASGVSGFVLGLSPLTPPPVFRTPEKGVLFIEDEPPCYAGPCDARRSFWAYACGWSYDWRRCGAQTPPSFPILATPIAAMTPAPMTPHIFQATMTTAPMTPDIPQATMTTAPMTPHIPQATITPAATTPDIHQTTMTSAPTTPVSYPF